MILEKPAAEAPKLLAKGLEMFDWFGLHARKESTPRPLEIRAADLERLAGHPQRPLR